MIHRVKNQRKKGKKGKPRLKRKVIPLPIKEANHDVLIKPNDVYNDFRSAIPRMFLTELHPTDFPLLHKLFFGRGFISLLRKDGFDPNTWKHFNKPVSLSLLDPSYENSEDYAKAARALIEMKRKWPEGIHLLWYPVLANKRRYLSKMLQTLREELDDPPLVLAKRFYTRKKRTPWSPPVELLNVQLLTRDLPPDEPEETPSTKRRDLESYRGLYGSGMVLVGAPASIHKQVTRLVPWLHKHLREEEGQGGSLVEFLCEQ
jgi:23S rRNA A2030 N6-methylase RlmJ